MTRRFHTNWPPYTLAWRIAVRGTLVWLFLLGMTSFAVATRGGDAAPFDPGLANTLVIASFAAATVWIDARRRRELHFLSNLGVATWPVLVLAVLPGIALELARAFGGR